MPPVKYWEIIGDKLSAAGWAWLTGNNALFNNICGTDNTAVGLNALLVNTAGGSNTAFGRDALRNRR